MKKYIFLVLIILFTTNNYADSNLKSKNSDNISKYLKSWVLTGSIAKLWDNAGETQTILLAPKIKKTYAANKNTDSIIQASIFWGVQKPLYNKIFGQIGVNVATISNANLTGEIWDDANPKFNNLTYSYFLKATRVAAKGLILFDMDYIVIPWISTSIGISYNYSANFINNTKIFEVLPNINFNKYTTQALTYSFGVGLQKNLSKQLQIGCGYEFTDWGGSRLSKSINQITYNAISIKNFYTNGVIFNLSYLAFAD